MHPIIVTALAVWWLSPVAIVAVLAIAYAIPTRPDRHGSVH